MKRSPVRAAMRVAIFTCLLAFTFVLVTVFGRSGLTNGLLSAVFSNVQPQSRTSSASPVRSGQVKGLMTSMDGTSPSTSPVDGD